MDESLREWLRTAPDQVLEELTGNVLPFWRDIPVDRVRGGFHGAVGNDGRIDEVMRTAVLCARVLWSFSAAARRLDAPEYLPTATHAYHYLRDVFWDRTHGGVFWTVDVNGRPLSELKRTYAQGFAIYGLAEYARATGEPEPLGLALETFDLLERHAADPAHGGYFEACALDWRPVKEVRLSPRDMAAPKSMNTNLHAMEAYATLVAASGDQRVLDRLTAQVRTVLDHIVAPDASTMRPFFDRSWRPLAQTVSFGHDIEAAWLLVEAAREAGDPILLRRAEDVAGALAEAVLEHGRDQQGAVLYEFEPATADHPARLDRTSHWWAQAEGMVGFLEAHRVSDDERFLAAAAACWRFLTDHHVDRRGGDWFKVLDADRVPVPACPKAGPWECPYHHVRACLEVVERLRAMLATPSTNGLQA